MPEIMGTILVLILLLENRYPCRQPGYFQNWCVYCLDLYQ